MRSPVSFFDVTPITSSLMVVGGSLTAILVATEGTFGPLMIVLILIYYRIQRFFRNTNTAIARLESVSRSPIYSDFSQALNGVSSLRAYNAQD